MIGVLLIERVQGGVIGVLLIEGVQGGVIGVLLIKCVSIASVSGMVLHYLLLRSDFIFIQLKAYQS